MSLQASYAFCQKIARTRARNFYYSFLLLSGDQRDAMCAIYAFMRYCDDISEGEGASREAIERWRGDLDLALAGQYGENALWPAFHDTVQRYRIPREYFYEMIAGVSSDLQPKQLQTFEELYRYCYQVASVVGLTIIHIFGFASPQLKEAALSLAEKCGIAFQLTNILRDVREDAGLGRIYIPAEDLERFAVQADDLKEGRQTDGFGRLMEFEIERARSYYRESAPLLNLIQPKSKASLWTLITIYSRLLDRVAESPCDVLTRRISLSAPEKTWIVLRAALGWT